MTQLIENITALVGDALVLALQDHHGFAPICPAFLAPSNTALRHTQAPLCFAVPGRMGNVFAITGGDERGESDINTDIDTSLWQGLWRNVAGADGIPLPGFACEPERFNLSRQR